MTKQYINDLLRWGWTQTELAKRIKTTQATISRWKTKDIDPGFKAGERVKELWKHEKKKHDRRTLKSS